MAPTGHGYESAMLLQSAVTAVSCETGVASGGITLHTEHRYHLSCRRDVHTYRFICLENDSMVD